MGIAIAPQLPLRETQVSPTSQVHSDVHSRALTGGKAGKGRGMAAYVHFPWCLAKCPYCDFVSYATPREAIDHAGYADAVLRELEARTPSMAERTVASVFFGGGTRSLWEPKELGRVLRGVRAALPCDDDVEITVECNPTSLDL